ncbi:MAG: hypothetical protein AB7E32_16875 [Desulfovibrio sp.]
MLTCTCPEYDGDQDSWWFIEPKDFEKFHGVRRERCASCGAFIEIGAEAIRFLRARAPRSEIEERIHGFEVSLAPWWHCERCGEIYLNLVAAGFCLSPADDMRDAMQEYWEMTGFTPRGNEQPSTDDQQQAL